MKITHIGNEHDLDVAAALNAFVRSATRDDVTVEFTSGVASISGWVSSQTALRAVEDLVLAHEGVLSVVNNLTVQPQSVPQEAQRQPSSREPSAPRPADR